MRQFTMIVLLYDLLFNIYYPIYFIEWKEHAVTELCS